GRNRSSRGARFGSDPDAVHSCVQDPCGSAWRGWNMHSTPRPLAESAQAIAGPNNAGWITVCATVGPRAEMILRKPGRNAQLNVARRTGPNAVPASLFKTQTAPDR